MSKLHHLQQQETLIVPPQTSPPSLHRNSYIFRSLFLIASLTVLVLIINYYLISHCPKDSDINDVSPRLLQNDEDGLRKVVVSVYYEVLCPDSKHFIANQLVPAYSSYGRYLDLRLVPFGKARVERSGDEYKFSCQHGPEECHGNRLHACLIQQFKSNQTAQLQIIKCSMERFRLWGFTKQQITDVVKDCRDKYVGEGQQQQEITNEETTPLECSNGDELLAKYGDETLGLRPRVTFIPTISVDGSVSNQRQILRDFKTVLCEILSKQGAIANNC